VSGWEKFSALEMQIKSATKILKVQNFAFFLVFPSEILDKKKPQLLQEKHTEVTSRQWGILCRILSFPVFSTQFLKATSPSFQRHLLHG